MKKSHRKIKPAVLFIYILLAILVIICVLPFYVMIINSTHSTNELYTGVDILPGKYFLQNLINLTSKVSMGRGFLNSAIISVSSTVLAIYFGAMTAFGLSEYRFKFRKGIYVILMCSMMIPGQLSIIGLFRLCRIMKLLDSYIPLILPSIANATTIFFLLQYMETTLDENLLDAARIDGATEVGIFHKVVFPITKPALATQGIFNFVSFWNNFFTPMILLFSDTKFTVPLLINNLNNGMLQDLGAKYAAISISIIPIIIVYAFLSRYITEGMMAGAVKG